MLNVNNLTVRFGGITAVSNCSFSVEPGQIFSIIGPNGAGKTTVFNAITGIYEPSNGEINFANQDQKQVLNFKTVLGWLAIGVLVAILSFFLFVGVNDLWVAAVKKPFAAENATFQFDIFFQEAKKYISEQSIWQTAGAAVSGFIIGVLASAVAWYRNRRTPDFISHSGIARTFQNIRLFSEMTVLENVIVGLDRKSAFGLQVRTTEKKLASQAIELLNFVGLKSRINDLACNLPYGDQRRLEIVRALATKPKLLLLDEPAAGMNPAETSELMTLIRKIRDGANGNKITVLLIEHHMNLVMAISDRIAVLDYGVKIAEGTPDQIRQNPKVIEAYLGKEEVG